jgi:hypothetical protein
MYNTLSCTKELNLFAERDKAKAHCEGALRGKFIDYGTTFGCTPAINMFDSNNAPSGGGAPPAKTATDETEVYTCIKGAGTRKQGTVTYQIFDLSTCKNESASKSYLSSKICSPNAVLNLGSGKFYCKQ